MRDGAGLRAIGAALAAPMVAMAVVLTGCAPSSPASGPAMKPSGPVEVRVSAASSLKKAFEELAPTYEQATGVRLVYNFGASGVLQRQIEGGAPVDVFVSASPVQVDTLTAQGLVSTEDTSTFIGNELVIAVPAGNPARIFGPGDLSKADKLTTGNPESTPVGTATKEWLTGQRAWDTLEPRFAFGENATQVTDYLARGEVDVAIMFRSEAKGRDDIEVVYTVPADRITPIRYVAAPLQSSAHYESAKAFATFLSSQQAREVLIANGFVAYGSE